jgi:ATP-dependent DNA helicase 2 subunit 1
MFHGDSYPNYFVKEREAEVNKSDVLFGMTLGATAEDENTQEHGFGTRSVRAGRRVCMIRLLLFLLYF